MPRSGEPALKALRASSSIAGWAAPRSARAPARSSLKPHSCAPIHHAEPVAKHPVSKAMSPKTAIRQLFPEDAADNLHRPQHTTCHCKQSHRRAAATAAVVLHFATHTSHKDTISKALRSQIEKGLTKIARYCSQDTLSGGSCPLP